MAMMAGPAAGAGGPPTPARRVDPADRAQLAESPVSMRRVAALFRPYRRDLAVVVAAIVAASLVGLALPFLVRDAVDHAIPQQNVPLLLALTGGMVAVAVVTQLLGVVQTWLSTRIGQAVMHDLRAAVFAHLQRQSLGFFTRTRGGEVQSRLVNDVGGMQSVVTSTATSIAANLTTTVATAVAMIALSWRLFLVTLVVLPPAVYLTRRVALLRRAITARQQRALADLHAQVEEGLSVSGIRLVKTLGLERAGAARFEATSARLADLELQARLAGRWRMALMGILFAVIPAVLYLAAGLPATSDGMTIGTLIAFTTLQAGLFRPLTALLNVGAEWIASLALFSRIFGYLDLEPEVPAPADPVRLDPAAARGAVRYAGVGFTYPGADRPALLDIDLDLPPGATVALVGATGSGKSTLAALLPRLHDPSAGSVSIDGVDVRRLDPDDLSALVGVVSQETYLVHDTVRNNLLLARPEASEAELWAALTAAQVADLVAGLPEGLATVVGARGHRFSGGEQQRIAVARTILRDPPILVLDEATSALDTRTERDVQAALDHLAAARTTLVIAHRLSTVRHADEIVVLDAGCIVERGTHDDLAAAGGPYAALLSAAATRP